MTGQDAHPKLLATAEVVIRAGWASLDLLGRCKLKLPPHVARPILRELERRGVVGPEHIRGGVWSVIYHPMGIDRTLALAQQRCQH